ncbi:hypothetical protein F4680DRAFT_448707 [Xylaria scruposa]|nr:hypothetical protein F4680DRAFT_448707 [Xylaria scruposa]
MQFKSLLVIGAIFAPLMAAAPAGESEARSVEARNVNTESLFKIMALTGELNTAVQEAMHASGDSHTKSQNNKAWLAYPPWPN